MKRGLWRWLAMLAVVAGTMACTLPSVARAEDTDEYTITYKTDAGHFSNGTDTNVVRYQRTGHAATTIKYSHTSNIDEAGNASGTYTSNLSTTDVVSIPGAQQLTIDVWYSTESTSYDWLAIYPAGVTPSQSNYGQASISGGKLGDGHASSKDRATHKTFTVDGDTAQFYFRSDSGVNYYGYYAVVTDEWWGDATVAEGTYEKPTDDDLAFTTWYSDEGHLKVVDPSTLVSDTTVYGHMDKTSFAVTYKTDAGHFSNGTDTNVVTYSRSWDKSRNRWVQGEATSGTYEEPTELPDGWTFKGWFSGKDYFNIADTSTFTSDATVYGHSVLYDHQGTCGTVSWGLKPSGELHFWPTNGTEGTLASNTWNSYDFWPWDQYCSSIKSITSEGTIHATGSLSYVFSSCHSLTDLSALASWDTSSVTSLGYAFYGCHSLTDISALANWDTSKVTSLDYAFAYCSGLTDLSGLASWDTSSVTNLYCAFRDCSSLTDLSGLASWDTSHVTNMNSAFNNCSNLTDISALANWDTSRVTYMGWAFSGCSSLTDLSGLAKWDTSSVTNLRWAFSNCSSLTDLTALASWDTSSVTDMIGAFNGCSSLTDLTGLAGWDTSSVTDMDSAFRSCSSLTDISALASWDMSRVTSLEYAFKDCSGLTDLSMDNWDTSKVTNTNAMFSNCPNLSTVTIGPKVTANVVGALPTPRSTAPYTGKWVREDEAYGPYSTSELASNWDPAMAGTWVWEQVATTYRVTFDPNGGTGAVATLKVTPGSTTTVLPASTFSRYGYRFKAWNTRADGTGRAYQPGPLVGEVWNEATGAPAAVGDRVTLYAIWGPETVELTGTGEFDLTLRQNEQVTIEGLPAGATYSVTETPVPQGWTLVRSQGATGIILPRP